MSAISTAFVGSVVYRFPLLTPVLEDHLEAFDGEILPHVFFGELTRWIVARFEVEGPEDDLLGRLLAYLGQGFEVGHKEVCELIAVSFLENLPALGNPSMEIRQLLSSSLKKELARLEGQVT